MPRACRSAGWRGGCRAGGAGRRACRGGESCWWRCVARGSWGAPIGAGSAAYRMHVGTHERQQRKARERLEQLVGQRCTLQVACVLLAARATGGPVRGVRARAPVCVTAGGLASADVGARCVCYSSSGSGEPRMSCGGQCRRFSRPCMSGAAVAGSHGLHRSSSQGTSAARQLDWRDWEVGGRAGRAPTLEAQHLAAL